MSAKHICNLILGMYDVTNTFIKSEHCEHPKTRRCSIQYTLAKVRNLLFGYKNSVMIFEHFYQHLSKGWRGRGGWQHRMRTHLTAWISNNQINVLDVYRLTVYERFSIQVTVLRLVCISDRHFVSVISAMWTWVWFTTNCGLNNHFVFCIVYTLNYKRVITSMFNFRRNIL